MMMVAYAFKKMMAVRFFFFNYGIERVVAQTNYSPHLFVAAAHARPPNDLETLWLSGCLRAQLVVARRAALCEIARFTFFSPLLHAVRKPAVWDAEHTPQQNEHPRLQL